MDEKSPFQFSLRTMGLAVLFAALAASVLTTPVQALHDSTILANRVVFAARLYVSAGLAGAAIGVLFRKAMLGAFCGLVATPLAGFMANL